MELIKISNDKIKISLNEDELRSYDLTFDEISGAQEKSRRAFKQMLIYAKEQTGFESDGKKALVQIFRAEGGGCEIFVSLIHKELEKKPAKKNSRLFLFSHITSVLMLCRALKRFAGAIESNLYYDGKRYFFELYSDDELLYAYALEHGGKEMGIKNEYIDEHCKVINERDAVDVLGEL